MKALIVVDMQNDFIDGALGTDETVSIVSNVRKKIEDICVISNGMLIKSGLREVPVKVDASCCAGVTPESHENALRAMEMCQIEIIGRE